MVAWLMLMRSNVMLLICAPSIDVMPIPALPADAIDTSSKSMSLKFPTVSEPNWMPWHPTPWLRPEESAQRRTVTLREASTLPRL